MELRTEAHELDILWRIDGLFITALLDSGLHLGKELCLLRRISIDRGGNLLLINLHARSVEALELLRQVLHRPVLALLAHLAGQE